MGLKRVSPLRYPGGKSKLYPFFKKVVEDNKIRVFIEPFAGGSGCALALLLNNDVDKIILNEYDRAIYAFWWSVLYCTKGLIRLIEDAVLSVDEWHKQKEIYKNPKNASFLALGFATLYLNRVNRSGILNAGLIGGLNQSGKYKMSDRFNKKTLVTQIQRIASRAEDIELYNSSAIKFMERMEFEMRYYDLNKKYVMFFVDPPYYEKGSQLYPLSFTHQGHLELSQFMYALREKGFKFVITYDTHDIIKNLYRDFTQLQFYLNYSVVKSVKQSEVMFVSELDISRAVELLDVVPNSMQEGGI